MQAIQSGIMASGCTVAASQVCRSGLTAFYPEKAKKMWCRVQLKPQELVVLRTFEKLKGVVCQKVGLDARKIELVCHKSCDMPMFCMGNDRKGVISIEHQLLELATPSKKKSEKPFLDAYYADIASFSDDPAEIKRQISLKSERELRIFDGLHRHCYPVLNDDEIYFLFKHEIKGHLVGHDQQKRAGLIITASAVYLLALICLWGEGDALFSTTGALFLTFLYLAALKIPMKTYERYQETQADRAACDGDERAIAGAKSFFKKAFIAEETAKALGLQRHDSAFLASADADHPSAEERYSRVCYPEILSK